MLGSNDHIDTEYNITSSNGKRTLNYLAMAFRSIAYFSQQYFKIFSYFRPSLSLPLCLSFPPSLSPSLSLSLPLPLPPSLSPSVSASPSCPPSLPPSFPSLSPSLSLQFTHTATDRVKRVLSAISFIVVSILSSALTTILATLPLLAAKILLFTRFGQILILDTAVAIIYTLVFCSTFLSLFGPLGGGSGTKRVLNACATITATVVLMAALYGVATEVMSHYNII